MDKKKKTILAVVLNIIAVITIVIMFRGDTLPEMLINTGKDLQPKLAESIKAGEFFKGSNASFTGKDVKYFKLRKQRYRVIINYDVTGDKEINKVILQLEGKVVDGKFNYDLVNQTYVYNNGDAQFVPFDANKDKALIIR